MSKMLNVDRDAIEGRDKAVTPTGSLRMWLQLATRPSYRQKWTFVDKHYVATTSLTRTISFDIHKQTNDENVCHSKQVDNGTVT